MIFILFVISLISFTFSFYYFKRTVLSPTVISSFVFTVFSLIYMILYKRIAEDISVITVMVIGFLFLSIFFGETLSIISLKRRKVHFAKSSISIYIKKRTLVLIFFISCIIALWRFYDLYKFSLTLGNTAGIFGTISSTRLAYALGDYTGGNAIIILGTLVCEIICYLSIFLFLHSLFKKKVKQYYYLLPIVGYCLIVISFTGRTEYLKLAVFTVVNILYLNRLRVYSINKKIFKKVLKISLVIILLFFMYGSLTRQSEESKDTDIFDEVISYSAASIVGLNQYLEERWIENPYFGYYTFQNIYEVLMIDHNQVPQHHLKFFDYGNSSSNIYTAFVLPIQDFGVGGAMLAFMIFSFITAILIKSINVGIKSQIMTLIYLINISMLIYGFASISIAFRFGDLLLSPLSMLKYTIFSFTVINLVCKKRKVS